MLVRLTTGLVLGNDFQLIVARGLCHAKVMMVIQ